MIYADSRIDQMTSQAPRRRELDHKFQYQMICGICTTFRVTESWRDAACNARAPAEAARWVRALQATPLKAICK
jgi:hypothetical protein